MKRTYITVEGEVKNYKYFNRDTKSKPKCSSCNNILNKVYHRDNGHVKNVGFMCKFCNKVFIDKKYKTFRVKIE